MTTIRIQSEADLPQAARSFIAAMQDRTIFAFYGKMGVGKTTFIKALCEEMGIVDVVNSPTFAIVNEYHNAAADRRIFHFDFYRIKRQEEVYDMGYEDYLYSGNVCLLEWPELIEQLLPEETVRVNLTENADGSRTLTMD